MKQGDYGGYSHGVCIGVNTCTYAIQLIHGPMQRIYRVSEPIETEKKVRQTSGILSIAVDQFNVSMSLESLFCRR